MPSYLPSELAAISRLLGALSDQNLITFQGKLEVFSMGEKEGEIELLDPEDSTSWVFRPVETTTGSGPGGD